MNEEFKQLEREIERQLAGLAPYLGRPSARPESVDAVKAAVGEEARRLGRRERRRLALRPLVGVAAAALLMVGLSLPQRVGQPGPAFELAADADATLADWVDALAESGEQFTRLLEEDWRFDGLGSEVDENGENSDPIDSLEESLQAFEQMMEA